MEKLTKATLTPVESFFGDVLPITPGWQSHLAPWCQRLAPWLLEKFFSLAFPLSRWRKRKEKVKRGQGSR